MEIHFGRNIEIGSHLMEVADEKKGTQPNQYCRPTEQLRTIEESQEGNKMFAYSVDEKSSQRSRDASFTIPWIHGMNEIANAIDPKLI